MSKYITKSFTFDGKRYYVRAKTEREALIKLANKQRDLIEGKVALSGSMTVSEWAEQAIDTYKIGVKDITLKGIKYDTRHFILEHIGSRPLKAVKPIECQRVLNQLEGKSADIIRRIANLMRFIFRTAVQNKLIFENPAENLVLPAGTKTSRRAITDIERKHLFKVAEEDKRFILFLLMLQCGCRPSEAIECRGYDIQDVKGVPMLHIRGTKSVKADRYVPIPSDLYERIRNTEPFDLIAPNAFGSKHTQSSYNRCLKSLRRALNISMGCKVYRNELIPPYPLAKDFVPYCLRHTYCTDLRDKGIDIRTAQYLMGHADISMTANVYTHMNDDVLLDAAERLESATGATPSATPNTAK